MSIFNLRISFFLLLSIVFSSCVQYSTQDLQGTWSAETADEYLIYLQFNDSLALAHHTGINEFAVYRYELNGKILKFTLLETFMPISDYYELDIKELTAIQMTLKDREPVTNKKTITYSRNSNKRPTIYSDQLETYEQFYHYQLAAQTNRPPMEQADINTVIGFCCGTACDQGGPVYLVEGLLQDRKFEDLAGLVYEENMANAVLAALTWRYLRANEIIQGADSVGEYVDRLARKEYYVMICQPSDSEMVRTDSLFNGSHYFSENINEWMREVTRPFVDR